MTAQPNLEEATEIEEASRALWHHTLNKERLASLKAIPDGAIHGGAATKAAIMATLEEAIFLYNAKRKLAS